MTHFQSWIESADILTARFCQLQARKNDSKQTREKGIANKSRKQR